MQTENNNNTNNDLLHTSDPAQRGRLTDRTWERVAELSRDDPLAVIHHRCRGVRVTSDTFEAALASGRRSWHDPANARLIVYDAIMDSLDRIIHWSDSLDEQVPLGRSVERLLQDVVALSNDGDESVAYDPRHPTSTMQLHRLRLQLGRVEHRMEKYGFDDRCLLNVQPAMWTADQHDKTRQETQALTDQISSQRAERSTQRRHGPASRRHCCWVAEPDGAEEPAPPTANCLPSGSGGDLWEAAQAPPLPVERRGRVRSAIRRQVAVVQARVRLPRLAKQRALAAIGQIFAVGSSSRCRRPAR